MTDSPATPAASEDRCGEEQAIAHILGDLFCRQCGANLMGRPVWRSEQTRLLVVRCSACQTVSHAESSTPYALLFRHRLEAMGLVAWGAFVVACLLAVGIAQVVGQVCALEVGSERDTWIGIPISLAFSGALGVLAACAFYHWRVWGHLTLVVLWPALVLCGMCMASILEVNEGYGSPDPDAMMGLAFMTAGMQIGAGVLGVVLGRPIGRLAIRMLLPNRSRQFFAFLWRRDGKQVPSGPF